MESELKEKIANLFEVSSNILGFLGTRRRASLDGVEVVFIDTINGYLKQKRCYDFGELLEAFEAGGKPIGLILLDWENPEAMEVKEFDNLTTDEQSSLMHAFAEAQDAAKEMEDDGD